MSLLEKAILIILFVTSYGCKKTWLELKPNKTQNVPSSLKDFQAMMDFSFRMNNYGFALGEIASDGHFVKESDLLGTNSATARNAYIWSHDLPYNRVLSWDYTYVRILYNNIILDGVGKIEPVSQQESEDWKNIKGQALFNRAEAFFELSQIYAPVYNPATADIDLGIPLRLTTDITEKSKRASVKDTYDQMIKDLKEAYELLPVKSLFPTRGSKPAASALLSRIYLNMEDYENALFYADKCLQHDNILLDYNNLPLNQDYIGTFNVTPSNIEILFQIRMYTDDIGNLTYFFLVDTSLYNQYADNDLRKKLFFRVNSDETISFTGNYYNNSWDFFCGLAKDEVYLIRAECYARKGKKDEALGDLNSLLEKRWKTGTFQPLSANSAEEVLYLVLFERKKELLMRGIRWSDLRRLNKDNRFKTSLSRNVNNVVYTLEPNSYKYTFPVPDDVLRLSGIQQNAGW